MNEERLQDLIDDVMFAPKYPDGSLRDDEIIIQKYSDNWEEEFEMILDCSPDGDCIYIGHDGINGKICSSELFFRKYNLLVGQKVKIKARKGTILIERIQ